MTTDKNSTVGDVMADGKQQAIRQVVIGCGVLVYTAGVAYAEVHGYSMLVAGIDPELLLWAVIGMVALGVTALALPLALHFWTHAPLQRIAAFVFYGVDLALLAANAAVDFDMRSGQELASWARFYMLYGVPTTPIVAAIGWSVLFLLDPAQKMRATAEALKASVQDVLSERIAEAAKAADITEQVESAAQALARDIVLATLGNPSKAGSKTPATIKANGRGAYAAEVEAVTEPANPTKTEARK